MLFLQELQIENFKNLESARLHFENKFICFTGENGAGKTNLVDAVHYLSLGKSYFSSQEMQNIRFDQDYFSIRSGFIRNDEAFQVTCGYLKGDKKSIKKNGESYLRFSEHVGEFPVVIITPYDIELIRDGSEERRRFLDILISQTDKKYLENLVLYIRILKQRNAQLKVMNGSRSTDKKLLDIYNEQLCEAGNFIYQARREFINSFNGIFAKFYNEIGGSDENAGLTYLSQMNADSLLKLLEQNFREDVLAERTGFGPHKDDLDLLIDQRQVKKFGSQGQQKSFLIALKLAEFVVIKNKKGYNPLLLLDDIFEKLDLVRIARLMNIISSVDFNQVFITDTDEQRVRDFLKDYSTDLKIFHVSKGNVQ